MTIDNDISFKFLDTEKLTALLKQVPDRCVISVNDVGNLNIYKRNGNMFEFIGFIDFLLEGEIET